MPILCFKPFRDMDQKDLRHRVRTKRDDAKGSRTGSLSPKVCISRHISCISDEQK